MVLILEYSLTLLLPQESDAVFTLGRNMFRLITNKTCFAVKSVQIRRRIVRIMIETFLF